MTELESVVIEGDIRAQSIYREVRTPRYELTKKYLFNFFVALPRIFNNGYLYFLTIIPFTTIILLLFLAPYCCVITFSLAFFHL